MAAARSDPRSSKQYMKLNCKMENKCVIISQMKDRCEEPRDYRAGMETMQESDACLNCILALNVSYIPLKLLRMLGKSSCTARD